MPGEVSALAAAIGTTGIGLPAESVVPDNALINRRDRGLSAVLINGTASPLVSTPAKSTPQFNELSSEISTIAASISTCVRRTSRLCTISMISLISVGSARTMTAFSDFVGLDVELRRRTAIDGAARTAGRRHRHHRRDRRRRHPRRRRPARAGSRRRSSLRRARGTITCVAPVAVAG